MTSMAEQLAGGAPNLSEMRAVVAGELVSLLGYEGLDEAPPEAARAFMPEGNAADQRGTGTVPGPIESTGGTPRW